MRDGGRIDNLETERMRKDGAEIHVALSAAPILDRAGDVIGVSTSARDITEQRQAPSGGWPRAPVTSS